MLLLASALVGCSSTDPGARPLRRLTPTEYNLTIRDLFGVAPETAWPGADEEELDAAPWPYRLPPDVEVHGFDGMVEGQVASGYLVEQYQAAAAHFAPLAIRSPVFWSCDGATRLAEVEGLEDPSACAATSLRRFANRAWRRPLTEAELQRLDAFHTSMVGAWGWRVGTTLAVQGLLQAPQFLYLIEESTTPLDAWDRASRLSYLLWDSMPDATLFEAASRDALRTRGQIERQARRMLDDPRARDGVVAFHRQWLELEDVYASRPSIDAYAPIWLPELPGPDANWVEEVEEVWSSAMIGAQAAMDREAERFVERTLFEGEGTLAALLTDNHGYASEIRAYGPFDTFRLYGVTEGDVLQSREYRYAFDDGNLTYGLHLKPVTFPADQRAGVLTMGAVLAAKGHPVHPAPVLRGVFVLERLACENIGQPPEDAVLSAPADVLTSNSTNRERLEAITTDPACSGCHDRINPLGFAFENYDSLGGWRDTDAGRPIDASGTLRLSGEDPKPFTGAVELAGHLAASDRVHDCYALQWTRYATGVDVEPDDPALLDIQQRFANRHRGDVRELLVDLAIHVLGE